MRLFKKKLSAVLFITSLIFVYVNSPLHSTNAFDISGEISEINQVTEPISTEQVGQVFNGITIVDNTSANPFPAQINVSTSITAILDANITLTGITHANARDIELLLLSPGGTYISLYSSDCDDPISDVTWIFDDEAGGDLPSAGCGSGTYLSGADSSYVMDAETALPDESTYVDLLSSVDGQDPNGLWSLYVYDWNGNGLSGSITNWSLEITGAGTAAIVESGGSTDIGEGGPTDTIEVTYAPATTAGFDLVFDPDAQCSINGNPAGNAVTVAVATSSTSTLATVSAVDDSLIEGGHTCGVAVSIQNSSDPSYANQNLGTVTANISDNDSAGISVTESDITMAEGDLSNTAIYNVALDATPPSGNVVIDVSTNSECEVTAPFTGTAGQITLANTTPQTITLVAVDDFIAESATHSCAVTQTVNDAATTANAFDGLAVADPTLNVIDNDAFGISITNLETPPQTSEGGDISEFSIVLTSQPIADVTISFTSGDTTEGTVSPPLTFTSANWDTPQTLTVTGVNDAFSDGNIVYQASGQSSSSDPNYDLRSISTGNITNLDDEGAAGLNVSPTFLLVAEDTPNENSFSVSLAGAPATPVTVSLTYDMSQLTLSTNTLSFDNSNWNIPQVVNVDAIVDDLAEGSGVQYLITVMANGDAGFAGLSDIVDVRVFDFETDIIGHVPNHGLIMIETGQATKASGSPSEGVAKTRDGSDIYLPADDDNNGYDTYIVTDIRTYQGETWLALWQGNMNWLWVKYDPAMMTILGSIDWHVSTEWIP